MIRPGPLTGYTIGITSVRRRLEFGAALERRGARVVYAPAMRIVAPTADPELLDATKQCLAAPLDIVVVTTGAGFRGWLDAAHGWGLAAPLSAQITGSLLVARGPKACASIRAAGLVEDWSPASESSSEVLEHLLRTDLTGKRIAVQLHGEPLPDVIQALRAAGGDVLEVPIYRWAPPEDPEPLRRLVRATARRLVDAVAFTSAPATVGFLAAAHEEKCYDQVLGAFRGRVVAACVGPVTAAPLQRAEVAVAEPPRSRLGALVRAMAEQVPARCGQNVVAAGHRMDIRGHVVVMDGFAVPLGSAAMAVLRCLAHHPGRVVARPELLAALAGDADDLGLDAAIGGLRASLGDSRTVQRVGIRGYRLAYEPARAGSCPNDHAYA